jgi:hypothetical protein
VQGRRVPAGRYATPWWKTALVGGAAGLGGAVLFDALFDGLGRHHGPGPFDGFGGPFGPGF